MTEDDDDKRAEQLAEQRETALGHRIAVEAALEAGNPVSELYRAVTEAFEDWQRAQFARAAVTAALEVLGEDAAQEVRERQRRFHIIKPGRDDTPETYNVGDKLDK